MYDRQATRQTNFPKMLLLENQNAPHKIYSNCIFPHVSQYDTIFFKEIELSTELQMDVQM